MNTAKSSYKNTFCSLRVSETGMLIKIKFMPDIPQMKTGFNIGNTKLKSICIFKTHQAMFLFRSLHRARVT
jgi:hypothetical protein